MALALKDGDREQCGRGETRSMPKAWRTAELAKTALGIQPKRVGGVGKAGKWRWGLPDYKDEADDTVESALTG